jgi:hypothetical protein
MGKELTQFFVLQSAERKKQAEIDNMVSYVQRRVVVAQKVYCIIGASREYTFIFKVTKSFADILLYVLINGF